MSPPAIPIIVGVGDFRHKPTLPATTHPEPSAMMEHAIRRAVHDTGLDSVAQETLVLRRADSLRVVPTWTWTYDDLPAAVAARLDISSSLKTREMPSHGGNQPALQCDEAAREIAARRSTVAILTGGEAMASLTACQKADMMPPPGWTEADPNGKPMVMDKSFLEDGPGMQHSIGLPIHIYPLYEIGRRARLGQTAQQNNEESATMYALFDKIAANNPYSWNYGQEAKPAAVIGSVSKKNRLICDPCKSPAQHEEDAACILTSTEYAEKIGIPKDKWIYVLGGAGTHEKDQFWERPGFSSSSAITSSIDAALDVSGLSKHQIDVFDFYSCFPIVPKLACEHVGLSCTNPEKPISLLGGLTSFGGAGNNYSMHALTAMTRVLRTRQFTNGLILANGGMLTHQHALCLSIQPRNHTKSDYPSKNPLPEVVSGPTPSFVADASGPATIETYTVEYDRSGLPSIGLIVGRLNATGERFLANHGDENTLKRLAGRQTEHINETGVVRKDENRNLFYFDAQTKL